MFAGVLLHVVQPAGPVHSALHRAGKRRIGEMHDDPVPQMHLPHRRAAQRAGVTGLAAALGIECGGVQHHRPAALAGLAVQYLSGKILQKCILFKQFLR